MLAPPRNLTFCVSCGDQRKELESACGFGPSSLSCRNPVTLMLFAGSDLDGVGTRNEAVTGYRGESDGNFDVP